MDEHSAAQVNEKLSGRPRPASGRWDLALALLAYTAASAADYLLTLSGLIGEEIRELNPILNLYIDHFGACYGLLVPKVLLGVMVVLASSIYIHAMHQQRRTRIRAEHILYPGALFTVLTPLHWVVLKSWAEMGG
jgi:hypothetical protein